MSSLTSSVLSFCQSPPQGDFRPSVGTLRVGRCDLSAFKVKVNLPGTIRLVLGVVLLRKPRVSQRLPAQPGMRDEGKDAGNVAASAAEGRLVGSYWSI